MSQLPINARSPEEQQEIVKQMYLLMRKQVQSYYKKHHLGSNSSVSIEFAQELTESIEYTVNQVGGVDAYIDIENALHLGQEILEKKYRKAKDMLKLVIDTSPQWQTECRWEALQYIRHYLDTYDHLHLAHKGPDGLFYPILIALPDGIQGIDTCLFYLNILWIENQIMSSIAEDALEVFWDHLPVDTLNQFEPLIINGIGKALLGNGLNSMIFEEEDHVFLLAAMMSASEDVLRSAADRLCQWLELKDDNAKMYIRAVIPQLEMWINSDLLLGNIENIFL